MSSLNFDPVVPELTCVQDSLKDVISISTIFATLWSNIFPLKAKNRDFFNKQDILSAETTIFIIDRFHFFGKTCISLPGSVGNFGGVRGLWVFKITEVPHNTYNSCIDRTNIKYDNEVLNVWM